MQAHLLPCNEAVAPTLEIVEHEGGRGDKYIIGGGVYYYFQVYTARG